METYNMQKICCRIKAARKHAKLTQSEVAELISYCDASAISDIERGKVNTADSLSALWRLSEVFEISPQYLAFGTPASDKEKQIEKTAEIIWVRMEEKENAKKKF